MSRRLESKRLNEDAEKMKVRAARVTASTTRLQAAASQMSRPTSEARRARLPRVARRGFTPRRARPAAD